MPREFARSERVAQQISRHLSVILRSRVKDPRVAGLSITEVEVSKDLRQAKVYVTSMLDEQANIDDTMLALEKAKGFLRGHLAKAIDMRHCPNLLFAYDNSISQGAKISALIDKALNKTGGQ